MSTGDRKARTFADVAIPEALSPKPRKLANIPTFKRNTVTEAVTRKLVQSRYISTGRTMGGSTFSGAPPAQYMGTVVSKTATNVVDAENMLQLLPDLNLGMQILIASILSPADMMSCKLTYSLRCRDLDDVGVQMLAETQEYYEGPYNITSRLEPILKDILFMKGCYPLAILPESAIDDAINSNAKISMESMRETMTSQGLPESLGVLGNPVKIGGASTVPKKGIAAFGMEALTDKKKSQYRHEVDGVPTLVVSDNPNVLKWPLVHQRITAQRVGDALGKERVHIVAGMEDASHHSIDPTTLVYKPRSFNYTPVLTIKSLAELEKENVGNPLEIIFPAEAVIPVHVPGSPDQHVGYFVVCDRFGNPVKTKVSQDFYSQVQDNQTMMREMSSQLLATTRRASEGQQAANAELTMEQASALYTEVVENDLRQRLTNGLYGENVDISRPEEIYRIMFSRALQNMMTQLVFIPTSQFVYMAFDYNDYGVGKSLLEDTKILGSIRAILLFANTMAAIKNSVNHVKVNLKLDPEDPDPDRTVEYLMHEFAKTRQASYPLGTSNPVDMVNFLQTYGVQVVTSGHEGYPETEIDLEERQANQVKVDTDLEEALKKRHLMGIHIPPELVDISMGMDFATPYMNSNVLLAKRGVMIQEKFTPYLEDWVRKHTLGSAPRMEKLLKIAEEGIKKAGNKTPLGRTTPRDLVLYFLQNLEISLPAPDIKRMENQAQEVEQYSDLLDKCLPSMISADIFDTSAIGDLSQNIETMTKIIKARYMRRFMSQRNILPELAELTSFTEDEGPAYDAMEEHLSYVKGITSSLKGFLVPASKLAEKTKEALDKAGVGGGGFSSDTSSESTDEGGGEDAGGGDGFDLGEDLDEDLNDGTQDEDVTKDAGNEEAGGVESAEEKPAEDKPEDEKPEAEGEKTE